MYTQNGFCCICICNDKNLTVLSNSDKDKITYYEKLISVIPEMSFEGMNNTRLTCDECCELLKIVYEFRQKCLSNKNILLKYITQEPKHAELNDIPITKNDDKNSKKCKKLKVTNKILTRSNFNFMKDDEIKIEKDSDNETNEEENCLINDNIKTENDDYLDVSHPELVEVMLDENIGSEDSTFNYSHKKQKNLMAILNPYACDKCDKRYPNEQHLEAHQVWHKRRKINISCPICFEQFKTSAAYDKHMLTHTDVSDSMYHCQDCNKRCVSKAQLENHVRKHVPNLPIICEICNKEFRQLGSLTTHMKIHTGEKLFQCSICNKRFTKKSDLNRHSRVHTGYKPHECEICEKKFSRSDHLLKHLKTHSNEVYSCNYCNKKFLQAKTLHVHMCSHTSDLPYKCLDCDEVFATKGHLNRHWCKY